MQRSHLAFTIACTFGLALVTSGAPAQTSHAHDHHDHDHPDVVADGASSWRVQRSARTDSPPTGAAGQISTAADNQILVELAPDDTASANLFDLNGRTLVFTPDGNGGYSRAVRSAVWEDDVGPAVADGEEVQLQSFMFDFAASRWGSFFVSRHGLITFGEPLTYRYWDAENRFDTMQGVAGKFVRTPTTSPLWITASRNLLRTKILHLRSTADPTYDPTSGSVVNRFRFGSRCAGNDRSLFSAHPIQLIGCWSALHSVGSYAVLGECA